MVKPKSESELERMRAAGRVVAEGLTRLKDMARPGLRTRELDAEFERLCRQMGGEPAFKGYREYPASICASVNEQVVHGIPGERRLAEGDLLSLDVGVKLDGYYGDAAATVPIGRIGAEAERLLRTGEQALAAAVAEMRPGARLRDVSAAIQQMAEGAGVSVVRQFVGHGIGREMHEDPGMVLALEPMLNAGTWEVEILKDRWTVVTKDRMLSVHFEHTVAVTADGPEVLTRLLDG